MSKILLRLIIIVVIAGIAGMLLIQAIPYGRSHQNPPVVREPEWANPETRALAKRACFDCHSNETVWPWYSNIAPISWLVYNDVAKGRAAMNFSEWNDDVSAGYIERVISSGLMPLPQYLLLHSEAKFTQEEMEIFLAGINETLSQ